MIGALALLMGQTLFPMPTGGRGGWSSDGCSVKDRRLNETTCTCSHLTSFGVLLVISPLYLALDLGLRGSWHHTMMSNLMDNFDRSADFMILWQSYRPMK